MTYKIIDLKQYNRLDHFRHFLNMQNPFVSVTVQLDITEWFAKNKALGRPFFLSFNYALCRAANAVPQLRQRIKDGGIIEYENCISSFIVMRDDGSYRYCNVSTNTDFEEYLSTALKKELEAKKEEHLVEEDGILSYFFVSCVPWFSYSAVSLPYPDNSFSNVSFTIGKYYKEGESIKIPVSIMANHALVDGLHIAAFYSSLEKELSELKD